MSSKHVPYSKDNQGKVAGKYLTPFQRKLLQKNWQQKLTNKQRQRIQIMLLADEGKTQAQICQELGCCQATARHWITQAKNNQAHNWKSNPIGRPISVNEQYQERLKFLVTQNPQEVNVPHKDYKYPFKCWTAKKLSQHLEAELGIKITPQHLNRLLKQMGLSTRRKSTCPTETDCTDRIHISDLNSVSVSDDLEVWNFNLLRSN